jgi:hypothetical protein
MQRHTWRDNTDEGLRFFRASHHAGTWTLQSQLKGEEDWITHDPITEEEWRALREVLWRKYQRGRGAWKLIEKIDRDLDPASPEGSPRDEGSTPEE